MEESGYRINFRMKATCDRITGFRFGKPAGYEFSAGQYFRLTLETRDGAETKPFSHANAPADPFIELATRMSGSAFKDALGALVRGDEVTVQGPYGSLIVPDGVTKAVFLVGGVGITPVRSIVRDAEQRGTGLRVRIFYGNHDQLCIPYSGEFAEYQRKDRRFEIVDVLEDPLPGWIGERGVIAPELVRRFIDPLDGWHYFMSGPPAMVSAMQRVTDGLSVPEERLSLERFTGY
jgi:ferredoxin-NADP reductase